MRRKLFLSFIVLLLMAIIAGFYLKKSAECFATSGGSSLPQIREVTRGQPIALPFAMLRISAPGCFKGHASESYKNISCGYRLNNSDQWNSGVVVTKQDNETKYEVECQIPSLPAETLTSLKLEYFFEYSPWGNPPERKMGFLSIK